MFRFLPFLFLLHTVFLRSGQCETNSEIYLFSDGNGEYYPGIVNHDVNLRWFFFNDGSQDQEKDIHFLLYTRHSNTSEELIIGDTDRLNCSKFNKSLPTKIIIHGFTNSDRIGFPPAARQAFLENKNSPPVNLIIVDWGKLAQAPWYNAAAKNVRLVGVKVARFIEFLVSQGSLLDQIHLIGHSLGSHVAGFAGSNLNNMTLSRITGNASVYISGFHELLQILNPRFFYAGGTIVLQFLSNMKERTLDPALPLFGDASDENRIDPSDAAFVQVIHTAGGESSRIKSSDKGRDILEGTKALAFIEPRGHADFYINGGRRQPGCGLDLFGACSHIRAYEYYLESVVNRKGFLACECDSWELYNDGNCYCINTAYMGEQCSSRSRGIFFLRTKPKRPYAFTI